MSAHQQSWWYTVASLFSVQRFLFVAYPSEWIPR